MRELLNFIRPPESAGWRQINRWRWNVCLSLLVLFAGTGFLFKQVSWASDVDKKISDAQKPLADAQKKTDEKVDKISVLLTNSLANSKAAEIRLTISKRCKTVGFIEREELAREKDRLQEEYKTLKGDYYREPQCGDL
jgi:ABC-type phosphate transport system auxiliary subunit